RKSAPLVRMTSATSRTGRVLSRGLVMAVPLLGAVSGAAPTNRANWASCATVVCSGAGRAPSCSDQRAVSQEFLERDQVNACFQKMSGIAVPQGVHGGMLFQLRLGQHLRTDALHAA